MIVDIIFVVRGFVFPGIYTSLLYVLRCSILLDKILKFCFTRLNFIVVVYLTKTSMGYIVAYGAIADIFPVIYTDKAQNNSQTPPLMLK